MPLKNNFPTGLFRWLVMLVAAGILLMGVGVRAATIVSPNGLDSVSGNANNISPFGIAAVGEGSERYQQIYLASDFDALTSGGEFITRIAFRPNAMEGGAFSSTLPSVRIDLSTSSAGPDPLSGTFANNVGANDTIVYGGASGAPLSLSSSFTGPAGGPKDSDIIINLTTPFFYDPAAGNLLLDVRNFGGGTSTAFDAVYPSIAPTRAYSVDGVDAAFGYVDPLVLITQFTTTAAPEPGTMALFGVGTVLIGLRRRWIRA